MKYIARISDSGPLSFRAERNTASAKTLPYVPGSTLLGGLAASHQTLRDDPEEFNRFFMSDESSFGNLYPATFAQDELADSVAPVYPLPSTARSCKRFTGFNYQVNKADPDDERHGAYDTLIAWALFSLSDQTSTQALDAFKTCPSSDCQEPMDRFTGFYRRDPYRPEVIGRAEVSWGMRTRTGINRATGTAEQGILYSRQVLSGMKFSGTVTVPDEHVGAFYDFVEEANQSRLLRLGNNRTRGFGRVTLSLNKPEKEETASSLEERLKSFTEALRRHAEEADVPTPHKWYLPLTLVSDAILLDRLLRHQLTISPRYLNDVWGLSGAELVYQNSVTSRVIGWNDLWRTPKADEAAIAKGSVFLYGMAGSLEEDSLRALLRLQEDGIGSRRREGFGRILVANPFHWEVNGA